MAKNKKVVKLKITTYAKINLFLAIGLLVLSFFTYFINIKVATFVVSIVLIYILTLLLVYLKLKPDIMSELLKFSFNQGQVQKELLKDLSIPYVLIDLDGRILWSNKNFKNIIGKEKINKKFITQIFPTVTKNLFPVVNEKVEINVDFNEFNFRIELKRVFMSEFISSEDTNEKQELNEDKEEIRKNTLVAIYFFDETELKKYEKENREQKLVAGLVYIDNYEEVLDSIEEVRRSLLVALIDRKINKYMQNIEAICKKIEKDKFVIIFQQKYLSQLQSNKFSLLDEVRTINIGNDMSVTLSISLGVNASSYFQAYEYARIAMDLALGRGGDQAVVKDGESISYYGGKTQLVEKSTRVKARVKAHALREIMETKDKIVIMGHRLPDVDSLGSAIGIYCLGRTLNKKVHIVINQATISIRPVMNNFIGNSQYEEDMFIDSEQAMNIVDSNTLLVVVDVNRPSYTECKELLYLTRQIVVLDHHRQTNETIENAVLSYIEPYASSACEMVAEILQYIADKPKLRPIEADAMYSGILVDTDNFVTKTGVRTFEAAAFLRRNGADVIRVRKMFRDTIDTYKIRAEAVGKAEVFHREFALSICPSEGIDSPTVLGAQIANELLDIEGIRASFVFTKVSEQVFISARSIDDVNVQVIMEKLGGGGHLSVAGAQLKNVTEKEAMEKLKEILNQMLLEGDL